MNMYCTYCGVEFKKSCLFEEFTSYYCDNNPCSYMYSFIIFRYNISNKSNILNRFYLYYNYNSIKYKLMYNDNILTLFHVVEYKVLYDYNLLCSIKDYVLSDINNKIADKLFFRLLRISNYVK